MNLLLSLAISQLVVGLSIEECKRLDVADLNGWSDSTRCARLDTECLMGMKRLGGLRADCVNSIQPTVLRQLTAEKAIELLDGSVSANGRYADYKVDHQIALLKCLNGHFDLLSDDYVATVWMRPAVAMAVLNNFSNAYLSRLVTADAFQFGPVFLASAIQVDLLDRLPVGVFRSARPDMMAALTPDCLRSLTPTHISISHPNCLSMMSSDQLALLSESCFPYLGMGHVASMIGGKAEGMCIRMWRASMTSSSTALKIHFTQWVQRHPCQLLRARRHLLLPVAVPMVDSQCRYLWTVNDLMSGAGGKAAVGRRGGPANPRLLTYMQRFPVIMCVVMGVAMTALLVQTCVLSLYDKHF